jgi:hypothetical protein
MLYIVGIALLVLLFIFVVLPLLQKLMKALAALIGNLFAGAVGIGLVILTIWLCIIFPFLLIPLGIYAFHSMSKSKAIKPKG